MFRFNPLFRLGGRSAFTTNVTPLPLKSSLLPFFRFQTRAKLTVWTQYNRHYGRNKIDWKSLAKPAAFTAAFCVTTTIAVPYIFDYTPLGTIFKRNPNFLVYTLIGINVAGFLAWKTPVGYRFMSRYGLLIKDNVRSMWSLFGSAFSHQEGMHILFNMFVLQSFGTALCSYIGASNFLVMYLNSAVISSFFSLAIPTIMRTQLAVASLGASGAIFSVFGTFSYLIPKAPVALFFIPIPGGAWFLYLGSIAFNVAGLFYKWGRHDYAAHLGGCIAAMGYGYYFDKKRRANRERRRAVAW